MKVVPKPVALLALHGVTAELFDTLRSWFDVPPSIALDLRAIDSAVAELGDPQLIAAMAMRKLQALNLLSTPGVRTTTDTIITIVQDLDRALLQAPNMRLHREAESTDWDAALAALAEGDAPAAPPDHPSSTDNAAERFRALHGKLHEAVQAVVEASDGEIVYLE